MSCKARIRKSYLEKRKNLSPARREEAKREAFKVLLPLLKEYPHILSFASKGEEIDLWPLNEQLAKERRLLFPRLEDDAIHPCQVDDLESLVLHPKWNVLEPDPALCKGVPLEQISLVLVPGAAFDLNLNRLGYGKGHYDRFLAKLKVPFWGVGFEEQMVKRGLEMEPHDVPLTKIYLF